MFQSKRHGLGLILQTPSTLIQILHVHSYDQSNTPFAPTHDMRADYKLMLAYYSFLDIYVGSTDVTP